MKRLRQTFMLFVILTILGTSCQSSNMANPSIATESPASWWDTWLTQPACQPPCWHNITPDVTTKEEALSILESDSTVVITYKGEAGITWNFGTEPGTGDILVSKNGKVLRIMLGTSLPENLNISKIVDVYSYPQYVDPYDCREGMCITALVYADLGIFLDVFIENTGTEVDMPKIEILPTTLVDRVYFIGKGNYQTLSEERGTGLIEWHGYGDYP